MKDDECEKTKGIEQPTVEEHVLQFEYQLDVQNRSKWSETKGVELLLLNIAVDDIMTRTAVQWFADIILTPSARLLLVLEYADDAVAFASRSSKL
ncbi:hypothetical protein RB195_017973 [Necator americanus]|uniref:Uncharacterized protein n=1 Tax=Necator americanus TaxID=51031 RepID=A0ABR1C7L2_NECAM